MMGIIAKHRELQNNKKFQIIAGIVSSLASLVIIGMTINPLSQISFLKVFTILVFTSLIITNTYNIRRVVRS